jgi:hypothetical protein
MARFQAYHYAEHQDVAVGMMRPPRSLPVDIARSFLVTKVLEGDYDYLWFVDQDCDFLPRTLERLMSWDVDIVGALCLIRGREECWPMAFKGQHPDDEKRFTIAAPEVYEFARLNYNCSLNAPQMLDVPPEGSLFEADVTGCHCLLIKRAVLETMGAPWFRGVPGQEDMFFCQKAIGLGYQVHVDFSVFAGHATGDRTIGLFDFMAHYPYVGQLQAIETPDKEQE